MCEMTLWAAVLKQAIKDANAHPQCYEDYQPNIQGHIKSAREWFKSSNTGIGSFLWVCNVLGFDPKRLSLYSYQR
ncbi:MAG: hypothetical protein JRJ11_02940 [Deltaproteobacteria bacterium]|nr:hypothetical protein [Deltaproteobacteria bacterium]MBW1726568.1 hypothetical protein [Deltaproteobacteria bacterium]MBW1908489.1 hypothetical protein [Deltaproteobacteria bacterium]MBW2032895.1 hypothetical protein [Deltaproteobacteria bacterium]MBW2113862.1 hypothetical protein [Deltaproteobacteria bacterium]